MNRGLHMCMGQRVEAHEGPGQGWLVWMLEWELEEMQTQNPQLQDSCPQESQMQPQLSGEHASSLVVPWTVKLGFQPRPLGKSPVNASCPGTLLHLLTVRDVGQGMVRLFDRDTPSQIIQ